MPFDGTAFRKDPVVSPYLPDAINFLERGLARVTCGYCWSAFYRPPTWYRSAPQFCFAGSLDHTDDGDWEGLRSWHSRQLAEKFLRAEIKGESLVHFGTRYFVRGRVIRAYKRALTAAYAELARSSTMIPIIDDFEGIRSARDELARKRSEVVILNVLENKQIDGWALVRTNTGWWVPLLPTPMGPYRSPEEAVVAANGRGSAAQLQVAPCTSPFTVYAPPPAQAYANWLKDMLLDLFGEPGKAAAHAAALGPDDK